MIRRPFQPRRFLFIARSSMTVAFLLFALIALRIFKLISFKNYLIVDGFLVTWAVAMMIYLRWGLRQTKKQTRESFYRMQMKWSELQMTYILKMPPGKVPVLISTRHVFPGAQQARCVLDESHIVWEQPVNLETVKELHGYVICLDCAVTLKLTPEAIDPRLKGVDLPTLEGQLWNGTLREGAEDQMLPLYREAVEMLRKKPKI